MFGIDGTRVSEVEVSEVSELKVAGIEVARIEVNEIARFSLARVGRGDSGGLCCAKCCSRNKHQRGILLRRTK